jgi:hypothetical protein
MKAAQMSGADDGEAKHGFSGFRVQGSKFKVHDSQFKVEGGQL